MEQLSKEQKLRSARHFICAESHDKNAVSLLLEVAAQVGEKVSFHSSEEHGLSLNKMFTCEVKFGSLLGPCKAIGTNKKMAKSSAAKQALEMLKADESSSSSTTFSHRQQRFWPSSSHPKDRGKGKQKQLKNHPKNKKRRHHTNRSHPSLVVSRTFEAGRSSLSPMSPGDWGPDSPQSASNPVGELQEMAKDKGWAPPSYDVIMEQGQAHDKTFVVECKIDDLMSQGEGRSKKSAKRISAENMLSMIRESERVSNRDSSMEEDAATSSPFTSPRMRTPELEPLPKSLRTGGATRPTKSPGTSASRLTSSFLYDSALRKADTINLSELKPTLCPDQSQSPKLMVKSLEKRGQKDNFSIKFHDLPDIGFSGNSLCFVELGTSPPAVCCGSGVTKAAAHADAAQNALQYLDVVSTKE